MSNTNQRETHRAHNSHARAMRVVSFYRLHGRLHQVNRSDASDLDTLVENRRGVECVAGDYYRDIAFGRKRAGSTFELLQELSNICAWIFQSGLLTLLLQQEFGPIPDELGDGHVQSR